MSEFHAHTMGVFDAAQQAETQAVAAEALHSMRERYGSGYPYFTGGRERPLNYHNAHHAGAVRAGTARMAVAMGLPLAPTLIGEAAAAAHDIVQLKPRGVMERESAAWLTEALGRKRLFTPAAIHTGALAILGTEPLFSGTRIVGQVASQQTYPTQEAELVAMAVACADFGELYAPVGPLLGHELYRQINGLAPRQEPPMEKLLDFQRNQVLLTETFKYAHPIGELVFGGLRREVAEHSQTVLATLERGDIATFDQVLELDRQFMRMHS